MAKFIIKYERNSCIGAAACVNEDPKNWVLDKMDTKANLVDSVENNGIWEKEVDESELEISLTAAKSCPVLVIHVFNKDTGEQLF